MSKIPWGSFDAEEFLNNDDTPWTKLKTIAEHLEDGDIIPFHLSIWLGKAIKNSKENPEIFLQNLNLKKVRGGQKKSSEQLKFKITQHMFDRIEHRKHRKEKVISDVLRAYERYRNNDDEELSRSKLQRWFDEYSRIFYLMAAQNEAERIIEFLSGTIPKLAETYKIDINDVISAVAKNHDSKYDEIMKDAEYPAITKENLEKWVKSYKNHSKSSAHKS